MKIIQTTDHRLIARLNQHVHALHAALYPGYFKAYKFEEIRRFFQRIIYDTNYVFLVIKDGEEALGYAWIEIRNYPETVFTKSYQTVYVHQLSIVSSRQNKGYGTKLMEAIYDIARQKGIEKVELDYWFTNENAKGFYKKHGFTIYREFVYKDLH